MVVKTVAVVFHADDRQIDNIRSLIEMELGYQLVFFKASYGKLWIKEGDRKGEP